MSSPVVFITPEMVDLLVEHTNAIIVTRKGMYAQSYRAQGIDVAEIKELIGLLMLAGTVHIALAG